MRLLNINNFITHLVWSGWIDKAKCGELKEAIDLCTVEAVPMSVIEDIKSEIEERKRNSGGEPNRELAFNVCLQILDKHISGKENNGI